MLKPIANSILNCFKKAIFILIMISSIFSAYADSPEILAPSDIPMSRPETIPQADTLNTSDKAFSYQIKINFADSKLDYQISPGELVSGNSDGLNAQVRFSSILAVNSAKAADACQVRLTQESIGAVNEQGEIVTLRIRGRSGDKALSGKFIHPDFNQFNEATFVIEGFIDTASYSQGLSPGNYVFSLDPNLFLVQFNGKQ